jgi:hypothetical protein
VYLLLLLLIMTMSGTSDKLVCIERERVAPKLVDMTELTHLDKFRRAFDEAAMHLGVPLIRTTLEIFSEDWNEFVQNGEISQADVAEANEAVYGRRVAQSMADGTSNSSTSSSSSASSTSVASGTKTKKMKESKKATSEPSLLDALAADGDDLVSVPPEPKKKGLSDFAMRKLGITPTEEAKRNPLKRFWELRKGQVESIMDWKSRVMLWDWVKGCLRGSGPHTGQWYYLVAKVSEYDVAKLYRTLVSYVEVPNIMSHGLQAKALFDLQIEAGEDVFAYCNRLDEQVERVQCANFNCADPDLQIRVPDWVVRWKILEAASQRAEYKFFFDVLRMQPPDEWMKMTREKLIDKLRTTSQNTKVMQMPGNGSIGVNSEQAVKLNVAVNPEPSVERRRNRGVAETVPDVAERKDAEQPKKERGRQRGVCYQFERTGTCTRKNCRFAHEKSDDRERSQSRSDSRTRSESRGSERAPRRRPDTPRGETRQNPAGNVDSCSTGVAPGKVKVLRSEGSGSKQQ